MIYQRDPICLERRCVCSARWASWLTTLQLSNTDRCWGRRCCLGSHESPECQLRCSSAGSHKRYLCVSSPCSRPQWQLTGLRNARSNTPAQRFHSVSSPANHANQEMQIMKINDSILRPYLASHESYNHTTSSARLCDTEQNKPRSCSTCGLQHSSLLGSGNFFVLRSRPSLRDRFQHF